MTPGQTAYNAYFKAMDGKTTAGEDLPEFAMLSAAVEKGWEAAEFASRDALKGDFANLVAANETMKKQIADLMADLEIAKSAAKSMAQTSAEQTVVQAPVGTKVTFVNHVGQDEAATVTGHGGTGVHLDIQGAHINDKYKRRDVPKGVPGRPLTYY